MEVFCTNTHNLSIPICPVALKQKKQPAKRARKKGQPGTTIDPATPAFTLASGNVVISNGWSDWGYSQYSERTAPGIKNVPDVPMSALSEVPPLGQLPSPQFSSP
jgi:hypothetical protein